MTEKDLFREIGMIDEKYVEEAASVKRAKILTPAFRKTLATAACLCICVGIYFAVRTVREESEESAKDSARAEMMTATADGVASEENSEAKAEGFDAIGEMFQEMTGTSNSMSDGMPMDTQKNQEAEEEMESCDRAPQANESVSTESMVADDTEDIIEELAEYSNNYEELCNGDAFVVTHGKVSAGMDKWELFLQESKRGNEAQVDVIRFTDEGDAIITRVCYKDGMYYLFEDSTRDAWGNGTYTAYEFSSINIIEDSEGYVEIIFADKIIMDSEAVDPQEMYYLVQYREMD